MNNSIYIRDIKKLIILKVYRFAFSISLEFYFLYILLDKNRLKILVYITILDFLENKI
jgi:hypothetical protein